MFSKGEGPVPQPQPRRRLDVETVEGIILARFTASRIVEEEDIQATFEQLQRILEERGAQEFVLDFRKVQFLSSAVLGRLILLQKKVGSAKGRMILCAIDPQILEVFKITKLDKAFTIKEDAEAALRTFGVRVETRRETLED
jgi:anti-sigma B factor antagonist